MTKGQEFLACLCVLIIEIPLCGYTVMTMWGWFVVPIGVPSLGLWQALGIVTLVAMATQRYTKENRLPGEAFESMVGGTLKWAFGLGIGWVYHALM